MRTAIAAPETPEPQFEPAAEPKLSGWKRFRAGVDRFLHRFPDHTLYRLALMLAVLAMLFPIYSLVVWRKFQVLHGPEWLILTPIFGTSSKVVLGAAAVKRRNWVLIAVTLLMIGSATLMLLALAKLSGIKIAL